MKIFNPAERKADIAGFVAVVVALVAIGLNHLGLELTADWKGILTTALFLAVSWLLARYTVYQVPNEEPRFHIQPVDEGEEGR